MQRELQREREAAARNGWEQRDEVRVPMAPPPPAAPPPPVAKPRAAAPTAHVAAVTPKGLAATTPPLPAPPRPQQETAPSRKRPCDGRRSRSPLGRKGARGAANPQAPKDEVVGHLDLHPAASAAAESSRRPSGGQKPGSAPPSSAVLRPASLPRKAEARPSRHHTSQPSLRPVARGRQRSRSPLRPPPPPPVGRSLIVPRKPSPRRPGARESPSPGPGLVARGRQRPLDGREAERGLPPPPRPVPGGRPQGKGSSRSRREASPQGMRRRGQEEPVPPPMLRPRRNDSREHRGHARGKDHRERSRHRERGERVPPWHQKRDNGRIGAFGSGRPAPAALGDVRPSGSSRDRPPPRVTETQGRSGVLPPRQAPEGPGGVPHGGISVPGNNAGRRPAVTAPGQLHAALCGRVEALASRLPAKARALKEPPSQAGEPRPSGSESRSPSGTAASGGARCGSGGSSYTYSCSVSPQPPPRGPVPNCT